ncbi:ephrin-A1b [Brachyhypopomus gauderio]|uniref:ephrin-A1b n=1 Tax=Brachyhypopomus gauderio TaxID=698409 RepID=UPI004041465F
MDFLWLVCFVVSVGAWCASAERHSVYWNSTNPDFRWDDFIVQVRINDYLDIICPHYKRGEVLAQEAERYVLYMVEREDYQACKALSFDQLRWECSRPFAPHAPEKFSEKFQRFTPFTLGKEFRPGESYYYISKPLHHHGQECLRMRVDVVGPHGSKNHNKEKEEETEGKSDGTNAGGVHNPSNRLPADDPIAMVPVVQRSVGSSANAAMATPASVLVTLFSVTSLLLLRRD